MSKTYTIRTVADLFAVPIEKRAAMFRDLELGMCVTELALGDKTTDCKAYGWDYESYRAGVYVGPKFGCIHWVKASA